MARVLHGPLSQHWDELVRLNNRGAGIYVTVNETDGLGRSAENIIRIRSQFVDLDGAPLQPVLEAEPKSHMVVETSPGKWHAYWLMAGVELTEFAGIQKRLAQTFNSDPAVHDLPRVMRLPGFYHRKGEPYLVRIKILAEDCTPYEAKALRPQQPEVEVIGGLEVDGNDINSIALRNMPAWVPALFGDKARPYKDGYRVSSKALGRDLEESIGITSKGIVDFGLRDQDGEEREGKRTPTTLVMEHGDKTFDEAVTWLCERLGVDRESHAPAFSEECAGIGIRPASCR